MLKLIYNNTGFLGYSYLQFNITQYVLSYLHTGDLEQPEVHAITR